MTDNETTPMPCPFCGSDKVGGAMATLHPLKNKKRLNAYWAFAYCSKCGAAGPPGPNALEAWNQRNKVTK